MSAGAKKQQTCEPISAALCTALTKASEKRERVTVALKSALRPLRCTGCQAPRGGSEGGTTACLPSVSTRFSI